MDPAADDAYANLRRFISRPPKNAALVFATGWHEIAAALMKKMLAVVDAAEAYMNGTVGFSDDTPEAIRAALAELRGAVQKKRAPKPENVEL
jgi:hypothetical protein